MATNTTKQIVRMAAFAIMITATTGMSAKTEHWYYERWPIAAMRYDSNDVIIAITCTDAGYRLSARFDDRIPKPMLLDQIQVRMSTPLQQHEEPWQLVKDTQGELATTDDASKFLATAIQSAGRYQILLTFSSRPMAFISTDGIQQAKRELAIHCGFAGRP